MKNGANDQTKFNYLPPFAIMIGGQVVDELVEIVGQRPYYASSYPAWILNCSNKIIMGQLKDFGNKNTWSTWPHHSLSSNHDREGLQIVKFLFDR